MSKIALTLLLLCSLFIVIESKAAEKPEVAKASSKTSPEASAPPRWLGFNTWAPSTETLRRFSEAGVNTVCCFPSNVLSSVGEPYNSAYPPIWNGPGNYDFDCLDRQVSDKLAVNPKAKFIFYLDLNTSTWWCRIRGDRNPDSFNELGRVAASDVWRRDTREYLQAVLRHLESKHEDVIVGYFLACGHTIEWLDHSKGEEGEYRRKAWRRWMTQRGRPDPVDIPPKSVRDHVSHGPFRDPVADGLAVDYWQFTSELIGDTILYYAATTQEVIKHRVPLGLCYGYMMEVQGHRLLYGGHLDFDRVYASKDLDWFVSPGTYYDRQIGGGSGFMVPISSIQHHGKGFLMSMDHRTPTSRRLTKFGKKIPGHEATFSDEAACIAGLRREFSLRLISGISTYWLDLFGKWFEGDALFESISQMREIWEQQARPREKSVAEVAVFADAKSMYYLDGGAKIHNNLLYKQRYGLHRMGTPYDLFSFGDLETLDLSLWLVAQAVSEILSDGEKEKQLMQGLLNQKQGLEDATREGRLF